MVMITLDAKRKRDTDVQNRLLGSVDFCFKPPSLWYFVMAATGN